MRLKCCIFGSVLKPTGEISVHAVLIHSQIVSKSGLFIFPKVYTNVHFLLSTEYIGVSWGPWIAYLYKHLKGCSTDVNPPGIRSVCFNCSVMCPWKRSRIILLFAIKAPFRLLHTLVIQLTITELSIQPFSFAYRTMPDNVMSVSYTHLDVYKRQLIDSVNMNFVVTGISRLLTFLTISQHFMLLSGCTT